MRRTIIVFLALSLCASARVVAQTNSWMFGVSSQWRIANDWSLHRTPSAAQIVVITNTGTFTVTINDQSTPASLTVSSLAVSNPLGSSTLSLINAPGTPTPMVLTVANSATIGMGAVLDIDDVSIGGTGVVMLVSNLVADGSVILQATSTLSASGASPTYNVHLGSTAASTGTVTLLGGSLIGTIAIGEQGTGSLVISNGTVQSPGIDVGAQAGANGLWQIAGGVNTVTNLTVASYANSTGEVVMTGGQLNAGSINFGEFGNGYLVISNGILQSSWIGISALAGGQALWQIAGGSNTVSNLMLASFANSTGEVVMTGGQLNAGSINFGGGFNSSASLVLSNGVLNTGGLNLANGTDGAGTLTVAGGTLSLSASMYIGYFGTGTVWLTGGEIDVTNNAPNTGLIRLVGNEIIRPYLAELVCSGGVLRTTGVDVGDPQAAGGGGLSSWTVAGGSNIVNNAVSIASPAGNSSLLTVSGGVLQTPLLDVGSVSGSGESSSGTLVISGGTVLAQTMIVGVAPGQTSQVSIAGGSLIITNGAKVASIGGGGPGQIIVSSGTFNASTIFVGASPISSGKQPGMLSISGGTVKGILLVGEDSASGSTGTVCVTGGSLPDNIIIGDTGIGVMYVLSNAVIHPSGFVVVGYQNGAVGSLNLQGGTSFSSREIDALEIGAKAGSTGTVWVTDGLFQAAGGCGFTLVGEQGSGRFSATNSTLQLYSISIGSQGTVECVGSELLLVGPCTTVNNNFISLVNSTLNSYSLVNNAGTIVANNSTLTFSQPVNNSGCIVATNGSVLFSGGITNSGAVLLGPSQFCITSIMATGNDLLITWPAFGGNHYRVQAATDPTASYSDITTDIVASGTGLGTTNYVDAGGVTNSPSRFYKIRQVY